MFLLGWLRSQVIHVSYRGIRDKYPFSDFKRPFLVGKAYHGLPDRQVAVAAAKRVISITGASSEQTPFVSRWWSRDGQVELDVMATLSKGGYLFGECKWRKNAPIGMDVYANLLSKIECLPEAGHRKDATTILFSLGGFSPEVVAFAGSPKNRLHVVGPNLLLPRATLSVGTGPTV